MTKNSNNQTQHEISIMREIMPKFQITSGFTKLPDNTPNPDFVLQELNIGVELTYYAKQKPGRHAKPDENIKKEKYVKNLVREMNLRSENDRTIYLHFSPHALKIFSDKDKKPEHRQIQCDIIKFVAHSKHGTFYSDQMPMHLSSLLSRIQIFERDRHSAKWQWIRAGFINFDPQIVKDRVTEKEKKLIEQYSGKYSENWLIIHSSSGCTVGFENDNDTFSTCAKYDGNTKFDSKFDRVIFYDCQGGVYGIKS